VPWKTENKVVVCGVELNFHSSSGCCECVERWNETTQVGLSTCPAGDYGSCAAPGPNILQVLERRLVVVRRVWEAAI